MVLLLLGLSGMTAMMGETTARDVRRSASVDGVQGQVRQQRQRRSDSRSDSGSDEGSYSESDRDDASDDSSSNSNSNDDDSVSYASTSLSSMDSEDDVSTGTSPTLSGENPTTTASPIECDEIEAESALREFLQVNIPADGITDFAKDFTVDFNLQSLPEGELSFEDGLTLQTSSLSDEQVIEVSLQHHSVHVEDLIAQMQRHTRVHSRIVQSHKSAQQNYGGKNGALDKIKRFNKCL